MLFDSSNIMKGYSTYPIIDKGYTKIRDKKRYININFKKKVDIEELNIYEYVNCDTNLNSIKLVVDGHEKEYSVNIENYTYRLSNLGLKNVKNIIIKFDQNIDISEIELFKTNTVYDKKKDIKRKKSLNLGDKIVFMLDDMIIYTCHRVNHYFNQFKKCG